jgi:CubicO group peptidase (beta-lactamase class C family)
VKVVAPPHIHGNVATGYEGVASAFEQNFTERGEIGAAFCVFRADECIVDLWGGWADRKHRRPWGAHTPGVIFSGTKLLTAVCLLKLIDANRLSLVDPVRSYWPEFAAAGKESITVADLVSHRAGLPGLRPTLTADDLLDAQNMAARLAEETPLLRPGREVCYHPLTFGWLCGALIQRIDGRTVGQYFADEIAGPLDLDVWIGLPKGHQPRVATLELVGAWDERHGEDASEEVRALHDLIWRNPPVFTRPTFPWNRRDFHEAEIAAAGGIGTARAVARLAGCLANGGACKETRILTAGTIKVGTTTLAAGFDRVQGEPLAVGVGVQLQTERQVFGPPLDAYGHAGVGGTVHGVWPTTGLGFSYVPNAMVDGQAPDPRAKALLAALHLATKTLDQP